MEAPDLTGPQRAEIILLDDGVEVDLIYSNDFSRGLFWESPALIALYRAVDMLKNNYPTIPFVVSDQRPLKLVPTPEDNRIDLEKIA